MKRRKGFIWLIAALALLFPLFLGYEKLKSLLGIHWVDEEEQRRTFVETYSQFIALQGVDKLILSELTSQESFNSNQFKRLIGSWVIGETQAEIKVVAHFQYYVPLKELRFEYRENRLVLRVPRLYLDEPVGIESQTLNEKSHREWFGPNPQKALRNLRADLSELLVQTGKGSLATVYPQAAEALAQNFYAFIKNNHFLVTFKEIEVHMAKNPPAIFAMGHSFCGEQPCLWEMPLGDHWRIVVE